MAIFVPCNARELLCFTHLVDRGATGLHGNRRDSLRHRERRHPFDAVHRGNDYRRTVASRISDAPIGDRQNVSIGR
jgi:hypothetical protein